MTTVLPKNQWKCLRSQVVRTGPTGQEQRILKQSCHGNTEHPQNIACFGFQTENYSLRSKEGDFKIYINPGRRNEAHISFSVWITDSY